MNYWRKVVQLTKLATGRSRSFLHARYLVLRRTIVTAGKYIRYAFWYSHFRLWYRSSYVYTKALPYRSHALVIAYGVLLLVASFSLTDILTGILAEDGATFFTSAGAMFGGIIAIFFSVSTLLMQSAAQSTSAGFYKLLGRDIWQEIIYWVIAFFALISFVLALVFTTPHIAEHVAFVTWVSRAAILTIGLTFLLLFVLYFRIYERIDPRNGIRVIRDDVRRYMSRLARLAAASSRLMSAHPTFEPKEASFAKAAGMTLVKSNMSYVTDRIDHLFDYHNKLVKDEERTSARLVIDHIVGILQDYFRIVSGGSLLVPNADYFFVARSDSEKFLTAPLQGLVSAGSQYMTAGDETGVSHVVWRLCHLCLWAADIQYAAYRPTENPIFSQCLGYLTQLTDIAIEKSSLEGTFQAAQALAHIAKKVIDKDLHIELGTIYTSLNKIAFSGLVKKQPIVWQQAATTYGEIIQKLVTTEGHSRLEYKTFFENYEEMLLWAFTAGKAEPKFREVFFTMKMEEMFRFIPRLAAHLAHTATFDPQRGYNGTLLEFLEEDLRMLRRMSEKMKSADHSLVGAMGNSIRDTSLLLLELIADPKWETEREDLRSKLGWYIHQPGWFIHHTEGTIDANRNYDSLTDAVAKIGIEAIDIGEVGTAKDACDILTKRAIEMLDREKVPKYGYTEPRIMENVCFIGILALKKKENTLFDHIRILIEKFEAAYRKKWFPDPAPSDAVQMSPKPDQLRIEVGRLRSKIQEHSCRGEYAMEGILDLPEDRMVQKIDLRDFDTFTLRIWNYFVTPSPLDDDIKDGKL